MTTLSDVPAAIEGTKILVAGQKIQPSGGVPHKISVNSDSLIVYPLTVKKRGEGTIQEEHNDPQKKRKKHKEYSLVEQGDKIMGKQLWGFSSRPIRNGDIRGGGSGRTSSHTGQEITLNGTCFLELIQGWRGHAIAEHPNYLLQK